MPTARGAPPDADPGARARRCHKAVRIARTANDSPDAPDHGPVPTKLNDTPHSVTANWTAGRENGAAPHHRRPDRAACDAGVERCRREISPLFQVAVQHLRPHRHLQTLQGALLDLPHALLGQLVAPAPVRSGVSCLRPLRPNRLCTISDSRRDRLPRTSLMSDRIDVGHRLLLGRAAGLIRAPRRRAPQEHLRRTPALPGRAGCATPSSSPRPAAPGGRETGRSGRSWARGAGAGATRNAPSRSSPPGWRHVRADGWRANVLQGPS